MPHPPRNAHTLRTPLSLLVVCAWSLLLANAQGQTFTPRYKQLSPNIQEYPKTLWHGGHLVDYDIQFFRLEPSVDPVLSTACALGKFNQKYLNRFHVITRDNTAPKMKLGFAASTGFNLFDPEGKSRPNRVYLFDKDGTTSCQVFSFIEVF